MGEYRGSGITSDLQLLNKLREFKNFDGVFPVDELPVHLSENHAIIINFEKHDQKGSHWVCAINSPEFGKIYIDPLGLPPPIEIDQFLKRGSGKKDYLINTIEYQPMSSDDCGSYCYHFVKSFLVGWNPRDFLPGNLKDKPTPKNNLIVRKEFWEND